jgi:hypothetical protein
VVQPLSQHLPGCRFFVMARAGSCEAGRLDALLVRNGRVGTQHLGQVRGGLGVVVFVGAGQGDDEPAADVVRRVPPGAVVARIKNALPRHEHLVEHAHAGALAVLAAEQGVAVLELLAGAARGARHDGEAGRVQRHGAADGEVGVFPAHVAAGHDQQFVDRASVR